MIAEPPRFALHKKRKVLTLAFSGATGPGGGALGSWRLVMSCELIIGGARSGKSRHAESRAREDGREVVVIATAEALDREMAERIEQHRRDRPPHWRTVEAPRGLAAVLSQEAHAERVLLVDCLTMWLSNCLTGGRGSESPRDLRRLPGLVDAREALLATLPGLPGRVLLVSNEVGFGLVPGTPLGRLFRDEAGRLNQRVAGLCDRVTLVVAGLPMEIKQS